MEYEETRAKGASYKLNGAFLKDPSIVEQLRRTWVSLPCRFIFFAKMKRVVKWYKELCLGKARERREREQNIRRQVEATQQALQLDPLCPRHQEELSELSDALQQLELWKIEGQQVRARVQWKSRGDSSTKESYKAVKLGVAQARIPELLSLEGVSCFEQEQLEGICFFFFSKLYQGRLSNPETGRLQEAVLGRIQPKLTDAMIESLKAPLKLEELTKAVGEMARTKAPGPDGIIIEFYQTLWPVIGKDYWQMAQEAIRSGSFPKGVIEGVISLLYKGGTCNTLNSWRPITLLNTSYKVFAKTLQLRLQPILMEVISPD
jgi:hypothetical protein